MYFYNIKEIYSSNFHFLFMTKNKKELHFSKIELITITVFLANYKGKYIHVALNEILAFYSSAYLFMLNKLLKNAVRCK